MEDEQLPTTCGQKCSNELTDLCCKPRARCFKGLAILSGIYTLGCALMLMIIPPVVKAHGNYDPGSKVDDNMHNMTVSTIVLMITFFVGTIINFCVYKLYEKREGRRESIINGQLMQPQDFTADERVFEDDD